MKLYKFYQYCGRMGEVSSVFLAEPEEVENIIGKEIYFGEILGKHSEVSVVIDNDNIKEITDNAEVVETLWNEFPAGTLSGHNPLDYYEGIDEDPSEAEETDED